MGITLAIWAVWRGIKAFTNLFSRKAAIGLIVTISALLALVIVWSTSFGRAVLIEGTIVI